MAATPPRNQRPVPFWAKRATVAEIVAAGDEAARPGWQRPAIVRGVLGGQVQRRRQALPTPPRRERGPELEGFEANQQLYGQPFPAGVASELTLSKLLPPARTVLATAVTVGVAPTALPSSPLASRQTLELYNNGTDVIYIGGFGVTTVTGIPVAAGAYYSTDLGTATLYAVSATAGQDVRVLEKA